ncbi:MAG: hypothetical protein JWP66_862 [Naasia sp.]|nr:hypothetical protein [Naasia sp.]
MRTPAAAASQHSRNAATMTGATGASSRAIGSVSPGATPRIAAPGAPNRVQDASNSDPAESRVSAPRKTIGTSNRTSPAPSR